MTYKHLKSKYLCILLVVVMLVAAIANGRYVLPVFAATYEYTSAITDLEKDEAFNEADYPDDAKDYTIKVIQIAESTDGELFVYTYQPCQKTTYLVATEINMSPTESIEDTKLYPLTLINSSGVFCKYRVNDLSVKPEQIRYYNITSIYRDWIKGIDDDPIGNNTVNSVAFEVGQLWTVTTTANGIEYGMTNTDTITVTAIYAGFLRFGANVFGSEACDAHYVAFSTDRQIDKLMEADITYITQSYVYRSSYTFNFWLVITGRGDEQTKVMESYGEEVRVKQTIAANDKGTYYGNGWFSKHYSWDRIQTVKAFKEQCNLTEGATNAIDGMDWVLRFTETPYTYSTLSASTGTSLVEAATGTKVSGETILRLKYETKGRIYNLGALSQAVTEGNTPDNPTNVEPQDPDSTWWDRVKRWFKDNWYWIVIAVVGVILLPVILTFLPFIVKGIVWIICLPFKAISALVKGIKNSANQENRGNQNGKKN